MVLCTRDSLNSVNHREKTCVNYCSFLIAKSFLFQVVAEGANGPTTPAADKILSDKNILVIPVSNK